MNFIQQIGHMIAPYALPAIAAVFIYLSKKCANVIVSVIGKKELEKIDHEIVKKRGLAYDAVRFAEDAYSSFSGETRLKHAVEWASNRVKQYGFSFNEKEIEGLCRSAFSDLVSELKTEATAPAAKPAAKAKPKAPSPKTVTQKADSKPTATTKK